MFKRLRERAMLKKIQAFRDLDGWLTDQEALGLYQTAASLRSNATVVEIGSWQGKSTYCLAKGLRSGKIYAIDPFNADAGEDEGSREEYAVKKGNKDLLEQFKLNMSSRGVLDRITVKKGYSYNFHQDFTSIDLLFIDGDHSIPGCQSDFDLYAPKVVSGGFIAFHDYYPDREELGPTHVIQNSVLPSAEFVFHGRYDSLWVGRRK